MDHPGALPLVYRLVAGLADDPGAVAIPDTAMVDDSVDCIGDGTGRADDFDSQ